ncbi:hypothetical protein BX265_0484 [Streptomyces sp. TLI_235]|nr:bpX6 domain-containing protein [Streptomyces sp. TLI_235]PBC75804.1 hypothetical protein BX265_0484 [Streptomyces sp. TLI_235]
MSTTEAPRPARPTPDRAAARTPAAADRPDLRTPAARPSEPGTARPPAPGDFRGAVEAAGFVLDTPVTGPAEAAARVLAHWQDGAELHRLPDGRWLLTLAAPVTVRADLAPGLPVRRTAGALVAVGTDGTGAPAGHLLLTTGGRVGAHLPAELPAVDPADWLDPGGLTIHRLGPVGTPPDPAPVVDAVPPPAAPDLRAAAGLGARSAPAGRLLGESGRPRLLDRLPVITLPRLRLRRTAGGPRFARRGPSPRTPRRGAALAGLLSPRGLGRLLRSALRGAWTALRFLMNLAGAALVLIGLVLILVRMVNGLASGDAGSPSTLFGLVLLVLLPLAIRARRQQARVAAGGATGTGTPGAAAGGAAGGRPRRPLLRGLLARLTLRSPAAGLVRGRHARYLQRLDRAFREKRWEDALRDAIQLGAPGGKRPDWLSLGLPSRYTGALRATPGVAVAGGTSALSGLDVQQYLTGLYRAAAEALEREGRIDEAAFVLADLLHHAGEAVALLDRYGRTAQAAELAEGRELDPDLVVRLWWRAGERDRAVRTAHRRGAFALAVERLTATDPAAARELRLAWAEHCRSAGDRIGAVEAVWPEEELRTSVVADLRDAVALGGPAQGRALGHLLALGVPGATVQLARAVIDGEERAGAGGRAALLTALSELPAADPVVDRELTTAAARAAVRDGGFGAPAGQGTDRARFDRLLARADPLAAADLPRPVQPGRAGGRPLEVTAADRPGTLPVLDAAYLDSGALLVACGQAGVRLLTPDGRTKARWDTPADRLVLADHGGNALVVADHGPVTEVSRLDLATRTLRPWTTLRSTATLGTYDGRQLIGVDAQGLVVLDTAADRPTVVWRELGGDNAQGDQRPAGPPSRTADRCSAIVLTRPRFGTGFTECWTWELPGWRLTARVALTDDELRSAGAFVGLAALAGGGRLLTTADREAGRTTLRWFGVPTPGPLTVDGLPVAPPHTDGDDWALTVPAPGPGTAGLTVHAARRPTDSPLLTLHVPAAPPGPGGRPTPVGVRRHATTATYWHRSGRILALAADDTTVLANLRITAD